MTQHYPLDYQDPVHEGFFDPIQELLSAAAPSLSIVVTSATALGIDAGTGNDQQSVAIEGRYRYRSTDTSAALPGATPDGTHPVFITGSDNDFGGVISDPDAATNYAFALEIRKTADGNPATAIFRKVGEVDVVSGEITAFRQMAGQRAYDGNPVYARSPHASQSPLTIQHATTPTVALIKGIGSTGTAIFTVAADGDITTTGSLSAIDASLSSAGKTALALPNTGANTGITIGGDATVYRSAAATIKTDGDFIAVEDITARAAAAAQSAIGALGPAGEAALALGGSADTLLYRAAANELRTPGSLTIDGTLTVAGASSGGSGILTTTSPAGGDMSGTLGNLQLVAGSVTTTEIAADTILNADISPSAAIARSKLNFGSGLVNADIAAAAAIARSKLDFGSGLVGADINAAAAIARSKLDFGAGLVNADISASAAIGYGKLNLTGSILNADLAGSIGLSKLATEVTNRLVPAGATTPFAGSSAPAGWALCDGAAVARTGGTYDALFAVIGTAYGAGNGSTTFNLPDLQGRVPVGKGTHGDVDVLGETYGSATVSARTPKHAHTADGDLAAAAHAHSADGSLATAQHTHGLYLPTGGNSYAESIGTASGPNFCALYNHTHPIIGDTGNASSTDVTGWTSSNGADVTGSTSSEAFPYVVLNYLIKL